MKAINPATLADAAASSVAIWFGGGCTGGVGGEESSLDEPQPAANNAKAEAAAMCLSRSCFIATPLLRAGKRRRQIRERSAEQCVTGVGAVVCQRERTRRRIGGDAAERGRHVQRAQHTHRDPQRDVDDVVARASAVRKTGVIAGQNAERVLRTLR